MSQVERQDRNPARAPDTAVACVAGWDAAAVLFFQSVQKSLPAGYGASDRGIHPTYRGTAKLHLDPICSLFRVTAMARTSEGLEWSWVIEILTPDLATTTLILAKEKLTTRPREAFGLLQRYGMTFSQSGEKDLIALLQCWQPQARLVSVAKLGWDAGLQMFVMPDGAVATAASVKDRYVYIGSEKPSGRSGSMAGWQAEVSAMCVGNPHLVFGVSLALAGPLLEVLGLDGAVFHLHGATSLGKSAGLRVANSVWRSEALPSWKTTSNGLEGRLAHANGTFLGMDELPQDPHAQFGADIYMMGNGVGKQRAVRSGSADRLATWKMFTMSTGEHDLATVLGSIGKDRQGGQAVRFIDVAVARHAYGSFHDIHDFGSGQAFVDHLRSASMSHAGHAGPAFVERLLADGIDRGTLATHLKESTARLQELLGGSREAPLQDEVTRVLKQFAMISMAGELATSWGITMWPEGTARAAVDELAAKWFEGRGGNIKVDTSAALERTRRFLRGCENRQFAHLHPNGDVTAEAGSDVVDYEDESYFYLSQKTFEGIHPGCSIKRVAQLHLDEGYLRPGNEGGELRYRLNLSSKKRPRVYGVAKSILED